MDIGLSTPALLFPAISLLLLAYTNRFLGIAGLIRQLHGEYREAPDALVLPQLDNLRRRVYLIRNMQFLGVSSLFLCVVCMLALFLEQQGLGKWLFGGSLLFLMLSLGLSLREIQISVNALEVELSDLDKAPQRFPSQMNKPRTKSKRSRTR